MRIVLTHPFCWPHVRRGSERYLNGLGRYLTARGHAVTTVSTHPEGRCDELTEAGRRRLYGPRWRPWMRRFRIEPTHTFFVAALQALRELEADVVHSVYYPDALAASILRRRRGYASILQLNGAAIPAAFRRYLPPERWAVRRAIETTDCFVTCSRFISDILYPHYGVRAEVVIAPVDVHDFPFGDGPADGRPVILAAADFNVPSKGVAALVQAFARLLESRPEALLRLSGAMSEDTQARVLAGLPQAARRSIEVLGLGRAEDLPRQYREATLLALPSMWEASGGVLLEALAAGTPVVITDHGGLPEFITPETGVKFDPGTNGYETHNVAGLARALEAGLELAGDPATRRRCRRHAERYSWEALGGAFETLYARLAARRPADGRT